MNRKIIWETNNTDTNLLQFIRLKKLRGIPTIPSQRCLFILLLLVLLSISAATAQSQQPLQLPRLNEPVVLDGLSDEPAWEGIPSLPMTMFEPTFQGTMTEKTEVLVAYNQNYLFIAGRFYYTDPSGIRANTLYRDGFSGDDLFEVIIDSFNDNENAIIFGTTPAGIRRDASVSNDFDGFGAMNSDFNTFWDVEKIINDEGWFLEMRIPFSSLHFQEDEGLVTMGLSVARLIVRKAERHVFPAISPAFAQYAFVKPSQAQKVVFEDLRPHKPIYFTPYAVGGLGQTYKLNNDGSAYIHEDQVQHDVGFDLKYSLTNNLVIDLSANTDFAQVEADDQRVNLTRFSLFFPEKRLFFQERAGIFNFQTGGSSRLFHSRRIGLANDGSLVPLLGGVRVTGRVGPWDIGFLDMQSSQEKTRPSENMGVLRLRRQVINPFSYIGAMMTSRLDTEGSYNLAYGLDGVFRLYGDDYLTFIWAQTFNDTPGLPSQPVSLDAGRFRIEWERRNRERFAYLTSLMWSGPDYNPGLGFIQRSNITQVQNSLSYGWLPDQTSDLQWHAVSVQSTAYIRNEDGTVESATFGPEWNFTRKSGDSGSIAGDVIYEDLPFSFRPFRDVEVPAGSYTFYRMGASYSMYRSNLLRANVSLQGGTFYDGWSAGLSLSPTWNVSKHLELTGSYQYNRIRFEVRNQQIDTHVTRLRVQTALNVKVSLHAFIQYNHTAESLTANVRFRYNFSEGTDLWIVYNEGIHTERSGFQPRLPLTDNRTIMLKYTHTFIL